MIFLHFRYDCFDISKCDNNLKAVHSKQNILIFSLLPNVNVITSSFKTNYIFYEIMDDD